MTTIFVLGFLFGWGVNFHGSLQKSDRFSKEFLAWELRYQLANPSMTFSRITGEYPIDLRGSTRRFRGGFTTRTGHRVSYEVDAHFGMFGYRGQLVISSGGRSATRTLPELMKGWTLDPKTEFPEAFQ